MTLLLVFQAIVLFASIAFGIRSRRRAAQGLDVTGSQRAVLEAALTLGGTGSLEPKGGGVTIPWGERELRLTGSDPGKHGPQTLHLGTSVAKPEGPRAASAFRDKPGAAAPMPRLAHVVLRHETARDAWGKRLGLNAEPQTGDDAFDAAIYIEHDGDRVGARHLLAIPAVRERVLALVTEHTQVVLNDEGHAVALRFATAHAPRSLAELRAAGLGLVALADVIPPVRRLELRPAGAGGMSASTLGVVVMASGIGLAGLATAFLVHQAPIDRGYYRAVAVVSLGVVMLAAAVAWAFARGRSRGLAALAWSIAAASVFAPPLVALGMATLNRVAGVVDRSESVKVTSVYQQSGKGGTRCYVAIAPWRGGLVLRDPLISCAVVGLGPRPRTGTVHLGHGPLGYEWIDSVTLDPR